jgi:hypothetical protein
MSKFSAFLKSPVGKFHTTFAVFILFNLLSGLFDLWVHYTSWLVAVHFYAGLLIIIAPLIYLLVAKNRKIILKAFLKMTMLSKGDFKKVKPSVLLFKLTTLIVALLVLLNALSGIFFKFHLLLHLQPYTIHVLFFKILLALVPLHVLLGFWVRGAQAKKPAKVRRASGGNAAQ